jgi:hypothetical protein
LGYILKAISLLSISSSSISLPFHFTKISISQEVTMKAIEILLHLSFLATATAQSTKSQHEAQYNAVCPSKVAEEEISPGLTVKYTCNFLGSYDKNSMFPSTLKECVERCQTTTGCTGSSWDKSSGYCALSGPTASKAHAGSILIEEVSPFPDDEEDEDPFPQSCEEEKDECDASLAQCEASLAAAQLAGVGNGAGAGAGSGTGDGTVPDIELYAKSCELHAYFH